MPVFDDIVHASGRISPYIKRTPVYVNGFINRLTGSEIHFKCENFQEAGAFKSRGAVNAVFKLDERSARQGVATHSSGNHAAALARAANLRGIKAHIVMPENAPEIKVKLVREFGGEIVFCKPTLAAREETLDAVVRETGAVPIHPYNHADIIAGQGTAALELLEEIPGLDIVMAPLGGGGLLSGTAITAKHLQPGIMVFGAEPKNADDAYQSFRAGKIIPSINPNTIADGLKTSLGELTFSVIQKQVDDILTVSENSIVEAMRLVWERMKIIIEPSCAVPVAAVMNHPDRFRGKKTGIILSGGNVDLGKLPWQ